MKEDGLRNCDLVMKGGITSGVVYPLAVFELAQAFHFKNIGGTSAGAIAAAAAAAAELGRQTGKGGSFDELRRLPDFLTTKEQGSDRTNLFSFFQPQRETLALFTTCIAGLGGGRFAPLRVALAAIRSFWPAAALGSLPGLGLVFFALSRRDGLDAISETVAGFLVLFVGLMLAVAGHFILRALRSIPRNYFGLCTGMPGIAKGGQALTPWLSSYVNGLAGLDPDGPPLTFGHLWRSAGKGEDPAINLEIMTTCLSHGRPYRLPFRDDDEVKENRQFYFREEEIRRLFPENVVRWMKEHPRSLIPSNTAESAHIAAEFLPLPEPADLPVVVAARMSLSFPILLCAVPLYAVDYSKESETDRKPERLWFSDGGICSNFPIHFFDTALPRWPTFGIDLTDKHSDYDAGCFLPKTNLGGTLVKWNRFDQGSGLQRFVGFLGSILGTAKGWADNAQCRLPGFRDRIAQISLLDEDGGLNLNMPPASIQRLCQYGRDAGKEFVRRFTTKTPGVLLDWDNHRRVRLRTALAAIEETLLDLERGSAFTTMGTAGYLSVLDDPNPPSYPWNNVNQQAQAEDLLNELTRIAALLRNLPAREAIKSGSPRPRPRLRFRERT